MNEFELIRRYFASQGLAREEVVLGIGDDGAIVRVPGGVEQVITTDVLVEGRHFLVDADAAAVGHKALAVNLSDLAAMGAEPAWFTLALCLPRADARWLEGFCSGLFALAHRYQVALIGGDTVRGPLTVTIQAHGLVPRGQALRRAGARAGDRLYVSGTLGDAALVLKHHRGELALSGAERAALQRLLDYPEPRVQAGVALRGLASSCIDVSDGLLADLGHVLEASGVGARVDLGRVPLSEPYRRHLPDVRWEPALAGGDDYELCFTVPASRESELTTRRKQLGCELTCIGEIEQAPGLRVFDPQGRDYPVATRGYDHFDPSPLASPKEGRS